MNQNITQERLREVLDYDPATGVFTWRVKRGRQAAGSVAGTVVNNCRGPNPTVSLAINVDGVRYKAHRLAWFYTHGEWPETVDHRNLDTLDNRLDNLRPATYAQQVMNRGACKGNRYGLKGVRKNGPNYSARITIRGKERHLGQFRTPHEAGHAYDRAARAAFGAFARTNFSV